MNDARVQRAKQADASLREAAKYWLDGQFGSARRILNGLIEEGVQNVHERFGNAVDRQRGAKWVS